MPFDGFASSPLLTPARLAKDGWEEAFRVIPEWAQFITLARPGEGLSAEENVFSAAIGGSKGAVADAFFSPAFVATLFELTRFGNSVRANIRESGDPRLYLKLIFAGASQDNMPVWRLIMDAQPGEKVEFVEKGPDYRPGNLNKTHGGTTSVKEARTTAIRHAKEAAVKAGVGGRELREYAANLEALFEYHDRIELEP